MTTVLPAQCFACARRTPLADPETGTPLLGACTQYPGGIPLVWALGGDHRRPRGDERDGLAFAQADDDTARQAFADWQATFGHAG